MTRRLGMKLIPLCVAVMLVGATAAAQELIDETYVLRLHAIEAAMPDARAAAGQLAGTYGGELVETSEARVPGTYRIRMSAARAHLLAADRRVASLVASGGVTPNAAWSPGLEYVYDGSGNITKVGSDTFIYDAFNRLSTSTVAGETRTYTYDVFGNRTGCTLSNDVPCEQAAPVNAANNRISAAGVVYDLDGNLKAANGHAYSYDAFNMQTRDAYGSTSREYVYTADDERIAVYTTGSWWNWSVRGLDGKVLREFTSQNGTGGALGAASWTWSKDYVWRDGLLLATRQPAGTATSTYSYHLDHLGTPRLITDAGATTVGVHDYHPFGGEAAGGTNEPTPSAMKFTGHERDVVAGQLDALDYMHARYYSSGLGRFLSVDPAPDSVLLQVPQSWNRYSYALNNPINLTDPTGRYPCRYKLTGSDAETAGVPDGTVVDGECVEAEADKTASENALSWVAEHQAFVELLNNSAAGFADTITFGVTEHIRNVQGTNDTVNPCSGAYLGGEVAGIVWSVAAGGQIANGAYGVNSAAAELGNITVRTAQFESTLAGLNEAQKLAALGGRGSALWQAMKNVANPAMWPTYAKTTAMTGPTLGGGVGALTGSVTAANAAHSTAANCF